MLDFFSFNARYILTMLNSETFYILMKHAFFLQVVVINEIYGNVSIFIMCVNVFR